MNQKDANDRLIDEALRLAASGRPPAGYLERLQRNIQAAPDAEPGRGDLWRWASATFAVAAVVFFAVILPVLLRPSRPAEVAASMASNAAQASKESRGGMAQEQKPHFAAAVPDELNAIPLEARPSQRHAKENKRAATRDVVNLFNYPLTRQEKLLVRLVHTAKPADLQVLNPEYQARLEAQQEAEFAAYLRSVDDSGNSSSYSTASKNSRSNQTTQE